MSAHDEAIRALAHQIWEAEGKPDGQSERHWSQARILAEADSNVLNSGLKKSIDPSEAKGPIEPAQPDQT